MTIMNTATVNYLMEKLPSKRQVYYYFKDRYALDLLNDHIGEGMSVSEIKKSPLKPLLNKPLLKNLLSSIKDQRVTPSDLISAWPTQPEAFTLSLGSWGDPNDWSRNYDQMGRKGKNLVLQLNFSNRHDAVYKKLISKEDDFDEGVFNSSCHPVHNKGRLTLAWARIDIDLKNNVALIEEIQSDWLREVRSDLSDIKPQDYFQRDPIQLWFGEVSPKRLKYYVERILAPYWKLWDEAMMAATIQFLRQNLGISKIYYYTFETGRHLKDFGRNEQLPPKSLYTKLPKKFCFKLTQEGPEFLKKAAAKDNFLKCKFKLYDFDWFLLEG